MSRSVDIDFAFKGPIDVPATLGILMAAGMIPSETGEVAYVIDEDGMFDWRKEAADLLDGVISRIGDPRWKDRVVGITLLFPEGASGGDLLFHPGRASISYVVSVNPKYLAGSSRFCDLGWYLERLTPLLEPLGLAEVEARDAL